MSTASGNTRAAVGNLSQAIGTSSVAVGDGSAASGANAVAVGHGALANGGIAIGAAAGASNSGVALGDRAVATGANSVALGVNSLASGANSVALGEGSLANQPDTISVGTNVNQRRIQNVADGTVSTDAVNYGQLQQSQAYAISQSKAYTDQRFNALSNSLNRVATRADAAAAAAMAVGGLAQATTPGKSMVTGGVGTWNGQTAFAFGLSHRMGDGLWIVKAGATIINYGTAGGNAAVGYEF